MTTAVDRMMDAIEWEVLPKASQPSDLPYATHQGSLDIGGIIVDCFILEDGRRVILIPEELQP